MVFQASDPEAKAAGSEPEIAVFNGLLQLGKKPGLDFSFQSKQFGGRIEKGGRIIDFQFIDPPDLAINVQGTYYHYERGSAFVESDVRTRSFMASQGVTLIFIDEDDALKDAKFYVREALAYRDHSRLGAGA
jgi:hypothetical protein